MIDERELFERTAERFEPPPDAFDRFTKRRVRRQRTRRVSAGVVALAIALAVAGWLGETVRSAPDVTPAPPTHGIFDAMVGRIAFTSERDLRRTSQHHIAGADPIGVSAPAEIPVDAFAMPVAWSRDGEQLLLSDGTILRSDGSTVRIAPPRRAPTKGSFSPDGSSVVVPAPDGRLEIVPTDGQGSPTPIRGLGTGAYDPQWSPDGSEIAVVMWTNTGLEIVTISPYGGRPHVLVTYQGHVTEPGPLAWSPDGSALAIAFNIALDKNAGAIWVVNADGTHLHPITPTDGEAWGPTWSPDGQRIAFVRKGRIVTVNTDGTDARTLRGGPVYLFNVEWNPARPVDAPVRSAPLLSTQTLRALPQPRESSRGDGKQRLISICVGHVMPCTLIPDA